MKRSLLINMFFNVLASLNHMLLAALLVNKLLLKSDMAWLWVLSPLWIPLCLIVIYLLVDWTLSGRLSSVGMFLEMIKNRRNENVSKNN